MQRSQNNWTREQTIVALSAYCKVPFNKVSSTNEIIVSTARLIGRSVNSVKMKVGNFGSFDPELRRRGIVGLGNYSKLDKEIWDEYYNNWEKLALDCANILAELSHTSVEQVCNIDVQNLPVGIERERVIRQRINQSFFRNAVLSSYNYACCISGIAQTELLEACHIVDWAENIDNRLNPANGLCLNPFFHKAYDRNLLAITPDYIVQISDKLIDSTTQEFTKAYLMQIHNKEIVLPDKFLPNRDLLALHFDKFRSAE
ncbi:MAG: HNH endonuclease [Candidatus Kapabacteria bacterium]|nr:HNH endonuclease [Candidatus Kapabacteria bacterium]